MRENASLRPRRPVWSFVIACLLSIFVLALVVERLWHGLVTDVELQSAIHYPSELTQRFIHH